MNPTSELQQKSDRLALQRVLLVQQLDCRAKTTKLGSFIGTFVLAPFVLGAAAPRLFVRSGLMAQMLRVLLLPSLTSRFLPHSIRQN
jgi:hypothetical protein